MAGDLIALFLPLGQNSHLKGAELLCWRGTQGMLAHLFPAEELVAHPWTLGSWHVAEGAPLSWEAQSLYLLRVT